MSKPTTENRPMYVTQLSRSANKRRQSQREADFEYFERCRKIREARNQADHMVRKMGHEEAKKLALKNAHQVGGHCGGTEGKKFWIRVAGAVDSGAGTR